MTFGTHTVVRSSKGVRADAGAGRVEGVAVRRTIALICAFAVVAVLVGALSPATAAKPPPGLSMTGFSPSSGPVGAAVTLQGTGFVAADTVAFSGTTASITSVNAKGTRIKTSVPPLASSGPITVTDPTTGQTVGLPGTTFTVTTGILASQTHVWPGQTFTLSGSGLSADQSEPVYIGTTQITTIRTNGSGAFQTELTVPWGLRSGKTPIYLIDPYYNKVVNIIFVLGDWPTFHHDAARTGVSTYEKSLTASTVSSLGIKWTQVADGPVESSPVVADGLVFFGSVNGNVYAVNATTGVQKWVFTTGGPVVDAPTVTDNFVFVGSYDGNVYALNALTGAKVWSYNTDNDVATSPAVAGGIVYTGSFTGSLYALDESTGAEKWAYPTGGNLLSSPSVSNGLVYFGSNDGNVYALNASTGSKVWGFATGGFVQSSPAADNGTVYIGSDDHDVYALNASTGVKKWSFATGGNVDSVPAVASGTVYVGSADGDIYALKASSGAKIWSDATGGAVYSSPAVANGVVYVGSYNHLVYALDASAGTSLWVYTTGDKIYSSPAVSNGYLYIGSEDNAAVYAFGL
jgi:outer membrane protein assembly factor BamB